MIEINYMINTILLEGEWKWTESSYQTVFKTLNSIIVQIFYLFQIIRARLFDQNLHFIYE